MNTPHLLAELIAEAIGRHGPDVVPCTGETWEDSLHVDCGRVQLWYNDPEGSTHLVSRRVEGNCVAAGGEVEEVM